MSHSMMLADWITIQAGSGGQTVIQNEAGWLDVSGYQDLVVYLQVSTAAGTTTLDVQTSPTRDEIFFTAKGSGGTPAIARFVLTSTTTGVQTLVISRWATDNNQPLAKYLRWQVALGATASATFRIWVTLNQAGY
jgi:hypothetical protein